MPRVVPSQVVTVIDRLFDWARTPQENPNIEYQLVFTDSPRVTAIVDLVDQVPDELIVLNAEGYERLRVGLGALKDALEHWRRRGGAFVLIRVPGYGHLSPVTLVRRALVECPDEFPAQTTTELAFITDQDFRQLLRLDISSAERAFSHAEWKATTVMAGSVVEALLLWALLQRPADVQNALAHLIAGGTLARPRGASPDEWHLHEYVEISAHLGIIHGRTIEMARLTRGFRNLVHPGRVQRLGETCDRATALLALGTVEAVVTDLTI